MQAISEWGEIFRVLTKNVISLVYKRHYSLLLQCFFFISNIKIVILIAIFSKKILETKKDFLG